MLFSGNQTDHRSLVVDPADGKIPYQPWARAKRQEIFDNHTEITKWEYVDPHTRCFLSGVPRMFYQGTVEIVQTPGYVFFLQATTALVWFPSTDVRISERTSSCSWATRAAAGTVTRSSST